MIVRHSQTRLAYGTRGMVSSAHPLASNVGVQILQMGGNAFDAAVAVAAALNVVEPMMSGIGGYGTILLYAASERECRYLNSSSRMPRDIDGDLFRPPTLNFAGNRQGALAISTPGNLRAWQALSQTYGRLPWSELLNPAIELAQSGFPVNRALARDLERYFHNFPSHAQNIYGANQKPLKAGQQLVQSDLAQSLSLIAGEGPDVLYSGSLGWSILETIKQSGGALSQADLDGCTAEWFEPISISYRSFQIYTAAPPATSFAALIRLGLMSRFDVQALGHNSIEYLHLFAEVTKHAYWCRLKYAADPDLTAVPLAHLLSPDYWEEAALRLNKTKAEPFVPPFPAVDSGAHTTHFVVADAQGNIVSATQTLGQMFGSRIMPPGTGIWLNNSLQYCSFEPKGNPMDAHPGRHKLSGDCPVIIFRDGRPLAALGTPGGHTIPQTVPQIIMNLIDFELNLAEAVAQPRISFAEPQQLLVDPTLPDPVKIELATRGHQIKVFGDGLGNAHGLTIDYGNDSLPSRFSGSADPRGEGTALGLNN